MVALLLAEVALWLLGIVPTGPFLQEFYAFSSSRRADGRRRPAFKLMCYDSNPSGSLDIDLRDPQQFDAFKNRFQDDEFVRHWRQTPFATVVRFNRLGFRDADFQPHREGVRRIVAVGDSFTYGHGLPESKCYPRLLEAMLRADAPNEPLEVINCGRGMAGVEFIANLCGSVLSELEPDVLVYGYFLNDPVIVPGAGIRKIDGTEGAHDQLDTRWLYSEKSSSRFSLGTRPLRGPRIYEVLLRTFEQRQLTDSTLDAMKQLHEPEAWRPSEEALVAIAREVREKGCRFVLVILPMIWQINGDYPFVDAHRHIRETAAEHGIEVIDMLPFLRGYTDAQLMLHPHDRHPNATYARVVAENLSLKLSSGAAVSSDHRPRGSPN